MILPVSLFLCIPQILADCTSRPAWSTLAPSRRVQFIKALKNLKSSGGYDRFPQMHLSDSSYTHGTTQFLLYHRGLLHEFELALGVPVPYWDSGASSQAPHLSDIFSADYFGGNGGEATGCVETGQFTVAKGWNNTVGHVGCIQRFFNNGATISPFYSPDLIAKFSSNSINFAQFTQAMEGLVHTAIHTGVGGDMVTMYSPNDPIFWLHHSNIDRIFARWQASCPEYGKLETYAANLDDRMPGLSYKYRDSKIDGLLCHNYGPSSFDVALDPRCPEPKRAPKSEPSTSSRSTSTISTSSMVDQATPTPSIPSLTSWQGADIDNANDAWFINVIRSMVTYDDTIIIAKRSADESKGNASLTRSPGDKESHTLDYELFQRVFASTGPDNSTNATIANGTAFEDCALEEHVADLDSSVNEPTTHDDVRDLYHLQYPATVPDSYLLMMNLDITLFRKLELLGYANLPNLPRARKYYIDELNGEDDFVSKAVLVNINERREEGEALAVNNAVGEASEEVENGYESDH